MHVKPFYLLSGVSSSPAVTGSIQVLGMESFTVAFYGSGIGNPSTGTFTLQGRLDPLFPYFNLYTTSIVSLGNSGVYYQFSGPFESLSVNVSGTTGLFSSVALVGYHSN